MFVAKILKKVVMPGLTFGEHCANLKWYCFCQNVLLFLFFYQN